MTKDDDSTGESGTQAPAGPDLLIIPATDASAAVDVSFEQPTSGTPDQLGFHLRFEGGAALLALENVNVDSGIEIKRALFEVPDVEFPLDVTGGALRFQKSRLTLRAIELAVRYDRMLQPDRLAEHGLVLLRERTRSGTLELLVSIDGAAEAVPVRAQGLFVPVGNAGVAIVLHEVVPFGPAPRPRAQLAEMILSALDLPGGHKAHGMIRRAEPFRTTLSRLLPAYGWKVPAIGDIRVEEVVLKKSEVTFRAWSGQIPDGWKKPKKQRRAPLKDAVALAVFAEELGQAKDDAGRIAVVDRLIDAGAVPAAVVPFAAEVLRSDPRRQSEGNSLVERALATHPDHLGVLSAYVDDDRASDSTLASRLATLGEAADLHDEAWVSARAYWAAARRYLDAEETEQARVAAEAGWAADPTLAPVGRLLSALLRTKDPARALQVGRAALDRTVDVLEVEAFATELASLAHVVENADAARALLERALRKRDRPDTLGALIELEIEDGKVERAAELLARLLLATNTADAAPAARADVQLLAARLSRAQGDDEGARMHLASAQALLPSHVGIALQLAELHRDQDDLSAALEVLAPHLDEDDAAPSSLLLAADLRVERASTHDAEKALALLARIPIDARGEKAKRTEAEAQALGGDVTALAALLCSDADATDDAATQATAFGRAAHLLAAHGPVDDTTGAVVRLLGTKVPSAASVAADAMLSGADPSALVDAVAQSDDVTIAERDAIALRMAEAERPLDALRLVRDLDDDDHLALRASLAEAGGDVAAEVSARTRWVQDRTGPDAAASWARLGVLHREKEGEGASASADAWANASTLGHVEVAPWIDAAIASEETERLATVVRREDAPLDRVPSEALRNVGHWLVEIADASTAADSDHERERDSARRVLDALASRGDEVADVELLLEYSRRTLEPRVAADVFARFADQLVRSEWALEAARLEESAGAEGAALARLLEAAAGPLGSDVSLIERAFEMACDRAHLEGIERATELLVERLDAADEKAAVFARAAAALKPLSEDAWERVVGRQNEAAPHEAGPLLELSARWMERGEIASGLPRFAAFLVHGGDNPEVIEALADVAVVAQESEDASTEVAARRMLADVRNDDDERKKDDLLRLGALLRGADDAAAAVKALERRILLGGVDVNLRAAWVEIATLHQELDAPDAAADAFEAALSHASDDVAISEKLLQLLDDQGHYGRAATELARRLQREEDGASRAVLSLRLGDSLDAADQPAAAERAWLIALRTPPFNPAVLERLLARPSTRGMPHRLRVLTHLAAVRSLGDDTRAAVHAAEAGAILTGMLEKNELGLAAYRIAELRGDDERVNESLRAQLEIFRAQRNGPKALDVVARLLGRVPPAQQPTLLEAKAEVLERILLDAEGAANARRAALDLDPSQRTSAIKLERYLREAGDIREAIQVRRGLADASGEPVERAQTYADLAEDALDKLSDDELAVELAQIALVDAPRLVRLRLLMIDALVRLRRESDACEQLGWLLDEGVLEVADQVSLARRKAKLELESLREPQAARKTLRSELTRNPNADVVVRDLVVLEEEMGEVAAAADALRTILRERPDGTDALGSRREILEWIGKLDEDAGDNVGAQDSLSEAAALGRLSRGAALRWARLCEASGDFDNAVAALVILTTGEDLPSEEYVAALGRLALNAERAEQPQRALDAWLSRSERVHNDLDALRAIERLAHELDQPDVARRAADSLLHQDAGDDEERAARMRWVARDIRDREQDAGAATTLFNDARALFDSEELRRETWECAELSGDDVEVFATLVAMRDAGDVFGGEASTRLAEAGLATGTPPQRVLEDAISAATLEALVSPRVDAVLQSLGESAPQLVAETYLAAAGGEVTASALRAAMREVTTLSDTLVVALADAHPTDAVLVREAAARDVAQQAGGRAADRLLSLAEAAGDSGDLAAAADALLVAKDLTALLGRFDALLSTLAEDPSRRQETLTLLRDQEAWEPIAELLDASLASASTDDDDRQLRMELVAVLRTGVEDDERAATHLETLVARDATDREAWGELIEAYESLDDNVRLADALGRRIERASGLEQRELVRRRTGLLLDIDEGVRALDQLRQAREEFPADAELKELERQVHEGEGAKALAAFHAEELANGGGVDDARALLALGDDVPLGTRVQARAEVIREDSDAAVDAAASLIGEPDELARLASALDNEAREALLSASVAALGTNASAALIVVENLRSAGIRESLDLALATAAWRLMAEGPTRARGDVQRIPDARLRAAATVHVARRANEPERMRGALLDAGGTEAMLAALDVALEAQTPSGEWEQHAATALTGSLQPREVAFAALRIEDDRVLEATLSNLDDTDKNAVAERARTLRITEARAPWMLGLASALESDARHDWWKSITAYSIASGRTDIAADGLDALQAEGALDAEAARTRAEIAEARDEQSAPDRLLIAAELAEAEANGATEAATSMRRRAIDRFVRAGAHTELGRALDALVGDGNDPTVVAEALQISRAARANAVTDRLLALQVGQAADDDNWREAVRTHVSHRQHAMHDAAGAFAALHAAIARDSAFAEEAYVLAAKEGLVEDMLTVVDDPLAHAGLLAVMGRLREAADAVAPIEGRCARLLEAEILGHRGALEDQRIALELMAEDPGFGPGPRERLLEAALARGASDDALRFALSLIASEGADRHLVESVRHASTNASDTAAARATEELRQVLESKEIAAEEELHLLDAWAECALRTERFDDVIDARLTMAKRRGEDRDWAAWLDVALPRRAAGEMAKHIDDVVARPAVVVQTWENNEAATETLLRFVLDGAAEDEAAQDEASQDVAAQDEAAQENGNRAAAIADAMGRIEPRSAAVAALLVDASEHAGRFADAANLLLVDDAALSVDEKRSRHLRAARLAQRAENPALAIAALLDLPLEAYTSDVRDEVRAVAQGRSEALPLVTRLVHAAPEEADIDLGFALASQSPDPLALAFAALRLRQAPWDDRAIQVATDRGSESTRAFFAGQGALASSLNIDDLPSDDSPDFATVRRFRSEIGIATPLRPVPTSPLGHARLGHIEDRQRAWREIADEAAKDDDAILAARCLARGGLSLADAPLEIRLIADSSLSDKTKRSTAIADALVAAFASNELEEDRVGKLAGMFGQLDDTGYTSSEDRRRVRACFPDVKPTFGDLIDEIEGGEGVPWSSLLSTLGRHPPLGARSTTAAIAARSGHLELSRALHPAVTSAAVGRGTVDIDLVARAGEARLHGEPIVALGLLRLEIGRSGSTAALEGQLREVATAGARFDLVSESFGREAAAHFDPKEASRLLQARAELHIQHLGDRDGALAISRAAAERAPGAPAPARLWATLAQELDNPGERIASLVFVEMTIEDAEESRACVVERARLLRERQGDPTGALRAIEIGEREYGRAPDLTEEQGRSHLALGEPTKAGYAFVEAATQLTEGDEHRVALMREGALLLVDNDEVEAGLDALVVGARAGDAAALDVLEDRARSLDASEALAEALRIRLGTTEDVPARRLIAMELAKHLSHPMQRRGEARQVLEQQSVEDDGDFNARVVLAGWYLEDRRTLDSALAYESAAAVPNADPKARAPAAQNAAVLLSALGDLERAGPLAESAIEDGALNEQTMAVAIAWHRAHERNAAIDQLLGRQLELVDTAREASYIWMERASTRETMGDAEGARQALARVLENRPDHKDAIEGLRLDAQTRSNFGTLRAALSRAADLGDDRDQRVAWLIEIAKLDAEEFDDLRAGLATLDRAVALAPEDPNVLLAKADFMVRSGDVEGLPALLDRATELGATQLSGSLELKRGDALLISGDRDAAKLAYHRATKDAESAEAAWDRVVDLSEGLGDDNALVDALRGARESASDDERRAHLARREARVHFRAQNEDAAADAWSVVIALVPGDTEALRALRDHYAKRRKLDDFEPLMVTWADATDDDNERARRQSELGAFLLDEVGAESRAREAFEAALLLNPREANALTRLAQIAYAVQDWRKAIDLLDLIEPDHWPRGPVAFAFAQAECAASLNLEDAETRLEVVLRQDPKHIPALELVAKRARADGRLDDAEDALEVLAQVVPAGEDPVRVANVCADLAELRLEQSRGEDAKVAAERALELHPTSRRVLDVCARAREAAGDLEGAAQLLASLSAVTEEGEERFALVARRAGLLRDAEKTHEAADLFAYLAESTDDKNYRREAIDLAMDLGDIILLERLGVDARPDDTNPGFHVLGQRAQALLDEGKPAEALEVLEEAFREGQGDGELARLGILASEVAGTTQQHVFFLAERLPHVTDPLEKQGVALAAGRLLRDDLDDADRAAEMLYVAHQCAPENLDLRLELTALYAKLPRLLAHAQTGVLQLIRRAPSDPRSFDVATEVALAQKRADKKGTMIAASLLLSGRSLTPEVAPPGPLLPEADIPLLSDPVSGALAPKAFAKGRTFGTLVALLGAPLESEFVDNTVTMANSERLLEARPDTDRYLERIDRLLPGRPIKFLVGDVDVLTFHPGAVLHAILPRHVLRFGDAVLVAFVARAYAVARLGGVVPETLDPEDMGEVRRLLEAAFLDRSPDEATRRKADRLLARVPDDIQGAVSNGARVALPEAPQGEAQAFAEGIRVIADRFALLVSGSLPGSLAAGALPEVLSASPTATSAALVESPRALDLCRFAAADEVWDLRRRHRLIID